MVKYFNQKWLKYLTHKRKRKKRNLVLRSVPKILRFAKVGFMENAQKLSEEEFLKTPEVQFFMDRLIDILLQQVEEKALEEANQNSDETRK